MSQARSKEEGFKGRFLASKRPDELLPAIKQVCDSIDGAEDYSEITTTDFDRAAAKLTDVEIPQAKSICQRLGVSWYVLLTAAHAEPKMGVRILGIGASNRGRKGWRIEDAHHALRRIAFSLGQDTLNPAEYAREREEMLRRAGRSATTTAGGQFALPTVNQLAEIMAQYREKNDIEIFGWDELLESAGLKPRGARESTSLTVDLAVAAFAEHFEALPNRNQLRRWANLRQLRLASECKNTETLTAARHAFNAKRVADGLEPLPDAETRRLDWDGVEQASEPTQKKALPKGFWVKPTVLAGMALAMKRIDGSKTLSQRVLNEQATKDRLIPGYSTVERVLKRHNAQLPGSEQDRFDQWRHEAAQLARDNTAEQLREMLGAAEPSTDGELLEAANEDFALVRADPDASAGFDAETAAWDNAADDVPF